MSESGNRAEFGDSLAQGEDEPILHRLWIGVGFLRPLGRLASRAFEVWRRQGTGVVARKIVWRLFGRAAGAVRVAILQRRPWIPDDRPVFLMVSHFGGGGTEKHVRILMEHLRRQDVRSLLVRPDHRGRQIWEEFDASGRLRWCRSIEPVGRTIDRLLDLVGPRHVHIHHTLGHAETLFNRLEARGLACDWTIHDYHAICPRIHLNQADGSYCGEPDDAGCTRCLRALGDYRRRPFGGDIATWRVAFANRLSAARRVFVPSADVARRLSRYMPGLNIRVRPHFEELPYRHDVWQRPSGDGIVRVAVIGAIVNVKGSDRLLACARHAKQSGLPLEFHVIGPTDRDRDFARVGNVRVSGPYRESQVFDLLKRAQCHLAFLPSVWPETYMYTLSVAMAAGFYTFCYDLGAQADRLRVWGHGQILPLESQPEAVNRALLAAAKRLAETWVEPPARCAAVYPDLLTDYYEFLTTQRELFGIGPPNPGAAPAPHFPTRTSHARLH
jgi:glycosyltransferase involved in cell wall biosynthesis